MRTQSDIVWEEDNILPYPFARHFPSNNKIQLCFISSVSRALNDEDPLKRIWMNSSGSNSAATNLFAKNIYDNTNCAKGLSKPRRRRKSPIQQSIAKHNHKYKPWLFPVLCSTLRHILFNKFYGGHSFRASHLWLSGSFDGILLMTKSSHSCSFTEKMRWLEWGEHEVL